MLEFLFFLILKAWNFLLLKETKDQLYNKIDQHKKTNDVWYSYLFPKIGNKKVMYKLYKTLGLKIKTSFTQNIKWGLLYKNQFRQNIRSDG